jgi:mannose-6-phosphate isomerase
MLSVQVHPSDAQPDLIPAGESGKTEAWVVIEASSGSRIYAGLKPGTTVNDLRHSLVNGTIVDRLVNIIPKPGDAVFIPAGTVHALGGDTVVFEVQQNSDVTFRLYDWGHVDAKTGKPRSLQINQALASIDFKQSTEGLVLPFVETTSPVVRESLFDCHQFSLGACAGSRCSLSAQRTCHPSWSALRAGEYSNTLESLIPSVKAKYGSCPQRPVRVHFTRAPQ